MALSDEIHRLMAEANVAYEIYTRIESETERLRVLRTATHLRMEAVHKALLAADPASDVSLLVAEYQAANHEWNFVSRELARPCHNSHDERVKHEEIWRQALRALANEFGLIYPSDYRLWP